MVMVGEAAVLVSHACQYRKVPNTAGFASELGTPKLIVSLAPGVKPLKAEVVYVIQEPLFREEREEILNVVETYSTMGVPAPIVTEPVAETFPLASTVNLFAPLFCPRRMLPTFVVPS